MKTESQIREAIRAARLKLRSLAHGTPERDRVFAEYCDLQEKLGHVMMELAPVKRLR